jgi:hypothetical protein
MILIVGFTTGKKSIIVAYFLIINGDRFNTEVVVGLIYRAI